MSSTRILRCEQSVQRPLLPFLTCVRASLFQESAYRSVCVFLLSVINISCLKDDDRGIKKAKQAQESPKTIELIETTNHDSSATMRDLFFCEADVWREHGDVAQHSYDGSGDIPHLDD